MIKILDILGIKVILNKIDIDRTFSLTLTFKTGSKNERDNERGLSHLLEHMMFTGTKKRTSYEISEEMDFYGAEFNAYTSKEVTAYYFNSLSSKQKETTDIMFDMIVNPIFPEDQLKKEKEIIFEEINMSNDETRKVVYEMMYSELFEGNISRNVIGSTESVGSFTRENLIDYYNRRYTRDNLIISISGNFDEEMLISMIKKYFINMKETKVDDVYPLNDILNKEVSIKKELNQLNIYMITKLENNKVDIFNDYVTTIVEYILGDGFSSRLFQEIREKRMLAYSVYSFGINFEELTGLGIYIGKSNNKYKEAIEPTKTVIEIIKSEGITERELEKTKNYILSSRASSKDNYKLAFRYSSMYREYGEIYDDKYIENILNKITVNDVNNKIIEILNDFSTCIIGDIDGK